MDLSYSIQSDQAPLWNFPAGPGQSRLTGRVQYNFSVTSTRFIASLRVGWLLPFPTKWLFSSEKGDSPIVSRVSGNWFENAILGVKYGRFENTLYTMRFSGLYGYRQINKLVLVVRAERVRYIIFQAGRLDNNDKFVNLGLFEKSMQVIASSVLVWYDRWNLGTISTINVVYCYWNSKNLDFIIYPT